MRYRPRMADAEWNAVREFVIGCGLEADLPDPKRAREALLPLSRISLWAIERGLPLDRESLLTAQTIHRFVAESYLTESNARAYEDRLRAFRNRLRGQYSPPRLPAANQHNHPYADKDLPGLVSDIRTLLRPDYQRHAWAILALSGGAGLRSGELLLLQRRSIRNVGPNLIVDVVGEHPRSIPVEPDFARYLALAIDGLHDDDFVMYPSAQTHDRRNKRHKRFVWKEAVPAPQRLREFWILRMTQRLPLCHLLYAAGVRNITSLMPFEGKLAGSNLEALLSFVPDSDGDAL